MHFPDFEKYTHTLMMLRFNSLKVTALVYIAVIYGLILVKIYTEGSNLLLIEFFEY